MQDIDYKDVTPRHLMWTGIGTLIIIILAQLSFNIGAVPITGQSLAVLVVAFALGSELGALATGVYLLLGIIGLPVFADGASGLSTIFGPTGGYLYGFLAAAYVVGQLGELEWEKDFLKSFLAMAIGTAIILFFGVLHLSFHIGIGEAFKQGFWAISGGAILKILIGGAILPTYYYLKENDLDFDFD